MTPSRLQRILSVSLFLSLAAPTLTQAQPEAEGVAPSVLDVPAVSPAEKAAWTAALERRGCSAGVSTEHSGTYYTACGEHAVWALVADSNGELRVVAKHRIEGKVRGLFLQGDEVWVASQRESAQPLRETALEALAPAALPAAGTSTSGAELVARSERAEGEVVSAKGQEVVVSLGTQHGVQRGDRIEVYTLREAPRDEELFEEGAREHTVLVGVVTALGAAHARLAVGFGEHAKPGMKAQLTSLPRTTTRLLPDRIGGQLIVEGSLRPFLPIDKLAFAAQADASATYLPEIDAYLKVEARPLGLLVGKDLSPSYGGAYASGGYDHTFFGLGLGVGLLYGQRSVNQSGWINGRWEERPSVVEKDTRFSALQHVRLGARDGLRVSVSTAVSLDKSRWQFAWVEADVQAPIGSRSWLTVRSSGSADTGFFFAEVGFRRMVRGNGGPGSLFLRPSAGVAGIAKQGTGSDVAIGPLVGLQVEARLGS